MIKLGVKAHDPRHQMDSSHRLKLWHLYRKHYKRQAKGAQQLIIASRSHWSLLRFQNFHFIVPTSSIIETSQLSTKDDNTARRYVERSDPNETHQLTTTKSSMASHQDSRDDDEMFMTDMSMASGHDHSQSNRGSTRKGSFELGVGKTEDKWVWWLRVMTGAVLVGVAIAVCLVVFLTGRGGENELFDQEFSNLAEKLVQSFEKAVKQRFDILETFGDGLTAEANGNWPFVTFRGFSEKMERLSQVSQIMAAHMLHRVTKEQLAEWNAYTMSNVSSWRREGISRERGIPLEDVETDMYVGYVYDAWFAEGVNTPVSESKPDGPYYPIWQSYPVSDFALANLDLGSDWEHTVPLNKVYQTQKPVFEYTYDYLGHIEKEGDIRASFIDGNKHVDYQDDPHATAIVPRKSLFPVSSSHSNTCLCCPPTQTCLLMFQSSISLERTAKLPLPCVSTYTGNNTSTGCSLLALMV